MDHHRVHNSSLTARTSRCVQIFLCCNPEETEMERKALREKVYPKLREYCRHKHGLEFQVIDAYMGVDPDDVHDFDVRKLRMKLLDDCLKFSTGPYFVALIGEQYGSTGIPEEIEANEFEMILCRLQNEGLNTTVLEKWYHRDENSVPAAYRLKSKTDVLPNYCNKTERRAWEAAREAWHDNFTEMKMIFATIIKKCLKEETIKPDQAQKYFISALEAELQHAVINQPTNILQNCICYICKIPHLTRHLKKLLENQKELQDSERQLPQDAQEHGKLLRLRDKILPSLATVSGLRVYTSMLLGNYKQDHIGQMKQEYIEGLCRQFYTDIVMLIDSSNINTQKPADNVDGVVEEMMKHAALCNLYATLSDFEWKEKDQIREYIVGKQMNSPFIIVGGPCTGKTVLLATCAKQICSWLNNCEPIIVSRFLSTGRKVCFRTVLSGICHQIAKTYHRPTPRYSDNAEELMNCFVTLLELSSEHHPLIVMIDGVDQVSEAENARTVWWLPKNLPAFTRLIISTTIKTYGIAQASKLLQPNEAYFLELKPRERKECNKILTQHLLYSNRRITSGQQIFVNTALGQCTLPLFVKLLYNEVLSWTSHDDINDQTLGITIHDNIERLLKRLEKKHGKGFVSRALGYITLANSGLIEAELLDILSLDNYVIEHILPQNDLPASVRVPYYALARLQEDLRGFLVGKSQNGVKLLVWANRHFPQVINRYYLQNLETVQQMHNVMAEYFNGRWSGGRGKPFPITMLQQGPVKDQQEHKGISEHRSLMGKYVDRQQPSQPWLFQVQSSSEGHSLVFPNNRKVEELAYHLRRIGRLEELYFNVFSSFTSQHAMIKAGHLVPLITELEENNQTLNQRGLRFLAAILKSAYCLLQKSPDQFSMVIQLRLLPFVGTFPQMFNFLMQAYKEGLQHCVIVVLHSPVITVPRLLTALCTSDFSAATDIIEIQSQNLVLVTVESGSVYAWNPEFQKPWEQLNTNGVRVTGARITDGDQFLVLATGHSTILVYDFSKRSLLYEAEVRRTFDRVNAKILQSISGFALCSTNVVVWFVNSTVVRIFDLNSHHTIRQLNCQHEVQCISFSTDGTYVLCGQLQSTVTIFNIHTGCQIATVACEFHEVPVYSIFLSASNREMYVVDKVGNKFIWDTVKLTQPSLQESIMCPDDVDELLNVEFSSNSLLLCKMSCIELCDTLNWNMSDMFKPPKNEYFIQAILSQDCCCIVAAISGSEALFVWKRETGQCVLILENRFGTPLRLSKCFSQKSLVSFTSKGYLISWDLDCIERVSGLAKAEKTIKTILSKQGKYFYTSDGTNIILKWSLAFCQIEATFAHADLVKNSALTRTGATLITTDVSGDLYVWDTKTGQNLHRIRYNIVTQLLVTPNDHFVVSLCEDCISKVWNLSNGHVVCNIPIPLKKAIIMPESTFILGLHQHRLLAVSLWSGGTVKRFECADKSHIIAFQTLKDYPDYILLITSSGNMFTWNVAEETFYQQVQLPFKLSGQLDDFQVSDNGSIAILSVIDESINVLDILHGKLCVIGTEGTIFNQQLTRDGQYVVYMDYRDSCTCDFHSSPTLNIVRITDGKNIGCCYLCKIPSSILVCECDLNILVGFEDGSVGIYAVADYPNAESKLKSHLTEVTKGEYIFKKKDWLFKDLPDAVWVDSLNEYSQ
ncbi:NACHT and WD repeat domain-containing protein 2-like [Leucoraja erinacea]|uniref:NACHT and WD repeat domain-containing protein 2-like n=1 Tax=Leucoraja erinaceus TaxID=7782 RepID=UPI0024552BD8|nr:NACHT and WD repeat domain-containing protein 2-like [Leucoraja erinacea]